LATSLLQLRPAPRYRTNRNEPARTARSPPLHYSSPSTESRRPSARVPLFAPMSIRQAYPTHRPLPPLHYSLPSAESCRPSARVPLLAPMSVRRAYPANRPPRPPQQRLQSPSPTSIQWPAGASSHAPRLLSSSSPRNRWISRVSVQQVTN
jgi:hypothetical protein